MKTMREQLTTYARYHRDRRNIATHFVGIPLIVIAVQILLSRVSVAGISLAMVASAGSAIYYIALDRRYGAAMTVVLAATLWLGATVATYSLGAWLALGLGSFVVGWGFQFVGHAFEGKKPAFVDDLIGLLIGPLFVVAELSFALGQSAELHTEIVSAAGPTHA
ncbi:MAG TPA: Mpo1-like protein [Kofleriaceae bacterium]|jgi:uncharacterized membrane protein YGL010W